MKTLATALAFVLSAGLASAQTTEIVGGLGRVATSGKAKGNIFQVDKSTLLLRQEWWLDFKHKDTLTFFGYRYHSRHGIYVREWAQNWTVTGTGPGWYSSRIPRRLIAGSHYMIGVAWTGTVKYWFNVVRTTPPVSFGLWYSGRTPTGLPSTVRVAFKDGAQYYQRLTSSTLTSVVPKGAPCQSSTAPRIVASQFAFPGGRFAMDLVEAGPNSPGVFVLVPGKTLARPIPLFGCSLWLNPANGVLLAAATRTGGAGTAKFALPIPNDQGLRGVVASWQTIVLINPSLYLTNAIQFTL